MKLLKIDERECLLHVFKNAVATIYIAKMKIVYSIKIISVSFKPANSRFKTALKN